MPSEVSAVGGDKSVEDLRRELVEAREQQTATAEILRVISSSPTDLQRMFTVVATSAARLCNAYDATIYQVDGDHLRVVANYGSIPPADTLPLMRGIVTGRAVLDERTIQVADLQAETAEYPTGSDRARHIGYHTILAVPLMRAGEAIGVISVRRTEVNPFTVRQIDLLKTFADQAVIAIENARLFEAEQARTKEVMMKSAELRESLEYQTATSEVLSVISHSPSNVQPVLDTIARIAQRLCQAEHAFVLQREEGGYRLVAANDALPDWVSAIQANPLRSDRSSLTGRVGLERRTVHVDDLRADPEYALGPTLQRGVRSELGVPLMRDGEVIGVIIVGRTEVRPFTNRQIALIETFADQAVIAIENTRLFEAEQASKRELQESLEYQTAISNVLSVISQSPNELQPVLNAIVSIASKLCEADAAVIALLDGDVFRLVASDLPDGPAKRFLQGRLYPPARGTVIGRVAFEKRSVHVSDVLTDSDYTDFEMQRLAGQRTVLAVPLMHNNRVVGVISLPRRVVRLFSDKQVRLLETFAEQAMIAINNVRLFEAEQASKRELQESLEYQTATSDVLGVISRSKFDLQPIIDTIVETATRLCQAERGALMKFEEGGFRLMPTTGAMTGLVTKALLDRLLPIDRGSVAGRVAIERRTVHILDLQADPDFTLMRGIEGDDRRTCLGVPLIASNGLLGALVLQRTEVQPFTQEQIKLVETFADQAVIAFENTRLFDEIVRKSRELEIASQHKSQFVANMSHELRTPLAAVLGYAELMQEGIYGALPETSLPILTRIRSNGKHLLGLINTVLDISKIEAGQFKLNITEYALDSIVETVMGATESLAATKKLAFKNEVAKGLPYGVGDEQRLTQVLLNLVGNAIKFTDAGEVRITAGAKGGHFALSVSDTGPGIPAAECEHIFEKFRQVDSSNTRAKGGTGLGLTIAREIVEMHGGRIWVESTLGRGSTFRIELPVRAAASGSS